MAHQTTKTLSKLRPLTYLTTNYDNYDHDAQTNTSDVECVFDTCKVRFDIAIRSLTKRSQSVQFQQVSRLYLSGIKQ